ncbi:MAG: hypothetical protein WCG05_02185 [Alphaproteobacteria bacterium]
MTDHNLNDFLYTLKSLDAHYKRLIDLLDHQKQMEDGILNTLRDIRFLHAEVRYTYLRPPRETLQ